MTNYIKKIRNDIYSLENEYKRAVSKAYKYNQYYTFSRYGEFKKKRNNLIAREIILSIDTDNNYVDNVNIINEIIYKYSGRNSYMVFNIISDTFDIYRDIINDRHSDDMIKRIIFSAVFNFKHERLLEMFMFCIPIEEVARNLNTMYYSSSSEKIEEFFKKHNGFAQRIVNLETEILLKEKGYEYAYPERKPIRVHGALFKNNEDVRNYKFDEKFIDTITNKYMSIDYCRRLANGDANVAGGMGLGRMALKDEINIFCKKIELMRIDEDYEGICTLLKDIFLNDKKSKKHSWLWD